MGAKASKLSKINIVGSTMGKRLISSPMSTTPKGYIPVSVGVDNETKRFMVHTTALRDAEFLDLLGKSAEEYGFYNEGILRIPYEAKAFEEMMMIKGYSKQKILRVIRPT